MIKGFGTWSETDILLPPSRVSKFWKTVYQTKQYSNRTLVLLSALINRRFFKAREQLITVPYWRQNIHQQAREIEIMAKIKTYFSTGLVPLGSYMYCTSKSPRAFVPRSLRIFVTRMMSNVMSFTGRDSMISFSVRGSCSHNKKTTIKSDFTRNSKTAFVLSEPQLANYIKP